MMDGIEPKVYKITINQAAQMIELIASYDKKRTRKHHIVRPKPWSMVDKLRAYKLIVKATDTSLDMLNKNELVLAVESYSSINKVDALLVTDILDIINKCKW